MTPNPGLQLNTPTIAPVLHDCSYRTQMI